MAMNNADALDAIHRLMDGREWNADTLASIAAILNAAGYALRDPERTPTLTRGEAYAAIEECATMEQALALCRHWIGNDSLLEDFAALAGKANRDDDEPAYRSATEEARESLREFIDECCLSAWDSRIDGRPPEPSDDDDTWLLAPADGAQS